MSAVRHCKAAMLDWLNERLPDVPHVRDVERHWAVYGGHAYVVVYDCLDVEIFVTGVVQDVDGPRLVEQAGRRVRADDPEQLELALEHLRRLLARTRAADWSERSEPT